jgi:hypothetical protein
MQKKHSTREHAKHAARGIAILLALAPTWALAQPVSPSAPAQASAPAPHHPAHPIRHRFTVRHRATSAGLYEPLPQSRITARSATTPAPEPNPNIGPPPNPPATGPEVDPTTLQIHYPQPEQGYTPGSSPGEMDDERADKVPGVQVKLPLQPNTPKPLPPPD